MIIAIDGHSACGKSTLAKDIAKHLGFVYIDSGAMYRALTLYLLEHKIEISISSLFKLNLTDLNIQFIPGNHPKILLNQIDVTDLIRSPEISEWVSEVAAIPSVRKKMVQLQREISMNKSVVMDGRDIGSVVFPNADIKLFLTADLNTRTQRRFEELKSKGIPADLESIKQNLIKRDHIDSTRIDSPLMQSPDAFVIDNSNLSREEQTKIALELIREHC